MRANMFWQYKKENWNKKRAFVAQYFIQIKEILWYFFIMVTFVLLLFFFYLVSNLIFIYKNPSLNCENVLPYIHVYLYNSKVFMNQLLKWDKSVSLFFAHEMWWKRLLIVTIPDLIFMNCMLCNVKLIVKRLDHHVI